jgi:DNA invertase Pin-like site-specific DNA recombinase
MKWGFLAMDKNKQAWLYCRIDAPKDEHGSLKNQKKELSDYAAQMEFDVVGVSEDIGCGQGFYCSGLSEAIKAAETGKVDALLIINISCFSRDSKRMREIIHEFKLTGIKIYSPLEGEIPDNFNNED